jgi:hypothetical protein
MENFRFAGIFWKLKSNMKAVISRNYEHFQDNKNLRSFESSNKDNKLRKSISSKN